VDHEVLAGCLREADPRDDDPAVFHANVGNALLETWKHSGGHKPNALAWSPAAQRAEAADLNIVEQLQADLKTAGDLTMWRSTMRLLMKVARRRRKRRARCRLRAMLRDRPGWMPPQGRPAGLLLQQAPSLDTMTDYWSQVFAVDKGLPVVDDTWWGPEARDPGPMDEVYVAASASIKAIALWKAAGIDGVFGEHWKGDHEVLTGWLAQLYLVWCRAPMSQWPRLLVLIAMLAKHANPKDVEGWRPIALLPVTARLMISLNHRLMMKDLRGRFALFVQGVAGGGSATDTMGSLVCLLMRRREYKKASAVLRLDVRKAFDCLPRHVIDEALGAMAVHPCRRRFALGTLSVSDYVLRHPHVDPE
jgi:hypothetical protein